MRIRKAIVADFGWERSSPGPGPVFAWRILVAALCLVVAGADSAAAEPLTVAKLERSSPVDFAKEIVPVLRRNCTACHNATRAKGDLVLETPQTIQRGGTSGPAVIAGNSAESLLFKAAAHQIDDLVMPPSGNKVDAADLTPEELGLLRRWIDEGARGEVQTKAPIRWKPVTTNWIPSLAVAFTPDSRYLAVGRGNQIHLYHVAARREVARLADRSSESAHRDAVNALAFNPDGTILASSSYREVKLWCRVTALEPTPAIPAESTRPWTAFASARSGDRIAVGTADGTVGIREPRRGAFAAARLEGGPVISLAFSSDDLHLAAATRSGRITILGVDPVTRREITHFEREPFFLNWLKEDQYLAVAFRGDSPVHVIRMSETNSSSITLDSGSDPIAAIRSVGLKAEKLLVASQQGGLQLFDPDTPTPLAVLEHGSSIASLDVSPDGSLAATGGRNGKIKLWNLTGTPGAAGELLDDGSRDLHLIMAERRLAILKKELEYQRKAVETTGPELEKASKSLTEATEKHRNNEKSLRDVNEQVAKAHQTIADAEKVKAQITTALTNAFMAVASAEKEAADARQSALLATDKAVAMHLAAEEAARTKGTLENLAREVPPDLDASTTEKALKLAADAVGKTLQARQLAEESRAELARELDAATAAAVAAAAKKAEYDRLLAELTPRLKEAEAQLAEAPKTLTETESRLAKAKIALATSEGDRVLAERTVEKLTRDLANTRSALAANEAAEPGAIADAQKERARATALATAPVAGLSFSPDGQTLAALTEKGEVQTWDTRARVVIDPSVALGSSSLGAAFNNAGELEIATSRGLRRLHSHPEWRVRRVIGGDSSDGFFVHRVNAVAWSPDGKILATGGGEPSRSGELKLWTATDGTLFRDLGEIHSDAILALAFSPDGKRLLSGGADRFGRIIDLGPEISLKNLEGHSHHVQGVAWLANGRKAATAGADGVVKIWDSLTGERQKNVEGFTREITGIQTIGIADQFLAVSGAGQARIISGGGEELRKLSAGESYLQSLSVSMDGRFAAAGDATGRVHVWNLEDGSQWAEFAP